MGCRLYPSTDDDSVLELLAGVPTGTRRNMLLIEAGFQEKKNELNVRFKEYESAGNETGMNDIRREWNVLADLEYEAIEADPNVDIMNSFELNGWGKLRSGCYNIIDAAGMDYNCGSTNDPDLLEKLLEAQSVVLHKEVRIEDLGGLRWS